jgi:hypothetical protein
MSKNYQSTSLKNRTTNLLASRTTNLLACVSRVYVPVINSTHDIKMRNEALLVLGASSVSLLIGLELCLDGWPLATRAVGQPQQLILVAA